MLEQGRKLNYRPKAIVLSSEKLTAVMRRTLQDAFGCRAYEEYGSVENILATECEAGNLHSNPDFGILEVVDAEGILWVWHRGQDCWHRTPESDSTADKIRYR